jgi:hypothetical protein
VKKTQRSFAVEYKSSRRKSDAKPNSIWGGMDLKAVARDVEETALPVLPDPPRVDTSTKEVSSLKADHLLPILTPPIATSKIAADTQEILMADGTDTNTDADTPAIAERSTAPKKQRRPRASKTSLERAAADTAAKHPVGGKKRRGRKVKSVESAAVTKRTSVKRAPKAEQAAPREPTLAGDEMVDLLQLEEENEKLRQQLADKLRSENAELRKKLQLDR